MGETVKFLGIMAKKYGEDSDAAKLYRQLEEGRKSFNKSMLLFGIGAFALVCLMIFLSA